MIARKGMWLAIVCWSVVVAVVTVVGLQPSIDVDRYQVKRDVNACICGALAEVRKDLSFRGQQSCMDRRGSAEQGRNGLEATWRICTEAQFEVGEDEWEVRTLWDFSVEMRIRGSSLFGVYVEIAGGDLDDELELRLWREVVSRLEQLSPELDLRVRPEP